MPKITYIEHSGKSHTIEVPKELSVMEGALQNNIPGIMLIVEGPAHVQLVMFMLMKNGLTNYKKKKMQNKICSIWLLNRKNLVD